VPAIKRIAFTGGGDALGLNAVIRAVVKSAFNAGTSGGSRRQFDGLLIALANDACRRHWILRLGGTIPAPPITAILEYPADTEGKVDY
jgi:6-phosphofructokinase